MIDTRNTGASTTITSGSAIQYTIDRWYCSSTGSNVSVQRVSGTNNNLNALQITGLVGNTGTLFGKRIESNNCYNLVNQSIVGSLRVQSSSITSLTWYVYYANVTDNFSSKTLVSTGTISINSTDTAYSFTLNAGANAANGLALEFSTTALLASQTITYQQIQLEIGNSPTLFERRPIAFEKSICERYYIFIPYLYGTYDGYWTYFQYYIPKTRINITASYVTCTNLNTPGNGNNVAGTGFVYFTNTYAYGYYTGGSGTWWWADNVVINVEL